MGVMSHASGNPLRREYALIVAMLVLLTAAAWVLLARQAVGMGANGMGLTMGMAPWLFLSMWNVMMAAMMFPAAAPMIVAFHQVQVTRRRRGEAFVATWIFVLAYLVVWALAGGLAYIAAVVADSFAHRLALSASAAARAGGAVIVLAGLYQVSALKDVCLTRCRAPLSFVMTYWREGVVGSVRMGVTHGVFCLGCCWILFAILFPLGIMNLAAMAAITLLIIAEKALPRGQAVAHLAAVGLVLYGAIVLAVPEALPTFHAAGHAEASMAVMK